MGNRLWDRGIHAWGLLRGTLRNNTYENIQDAEEETELQCFSNRGHSQFPGDTLELKRPFRKVPELKKEGKPCALPLPVLAAPIPWEGMWLLLRQIPPVVEGIYVSGYIQNSWQVMRILILKKESRWHPSIRYLYY